MKGGVLEIKCTSHDCDAGLHCYRATRKMKSLNIKGRCRACDIELVDWSRLHQRDVGDAEYTFKSLKTEMIRHHFWHVDIDEKAIKKLKGKSEADLTTEITARLEKTLNGTHPAWDGRQTPFSGNAVFYAQHATASCCRTCLEYWHNIPKGVPVTRTQISYLSDLVRMYLQDRKLFPKAAG